jgi:HAD superfamily hydrolase (TIGR01509 family)
VSPSRSSKKPSPAPLAELPGPLALLFDLDGTLVDTVNLRIAAWTEALRRYGIEVNRGRLASYIGSDGRWLAEEMGRAAGREVERAQAEEIDGVSGALFDELNTSPAPLPGARELLTALEESLLPFAIATSSMPGQVAASVQALRLPSPPQITDGSHVEHAKPEPDLLLAAASELGVAPERCWYVGDSTWDMTAAARAAMVGVGVTTGASGAPRLLSAGATTVVPSLTLLLYELHKRGLVGRIQPMAADGSTRAAVDEGLDADDIPPGWQLSIDEELDTQLAHAIKYRRQRERRERLEAEEEAHRAARTQSLTRRAIERLLGR